MKRGIAAVALTMLLLLLTHTALATNHGYGYWQLTDKQKYLYDLMAEQTGNGASEIAVEESRGITQDDAQMALALFISDYPEYSWLGREDSGRIYYFNIYKKDGIVVSMEPCYNSSISACRSSLQSAAQTALSTVSSAQSQYEKAMLLHDYLAQHVSYYSGGMDTMTAYGALIKGSANCTGYARAYQYLLQKAGIVAWTVMGTATNSSGTQDHAWNVAYLDGTWYYIDVTWDDVGGNITHNYFGLTLSQISGDHTLDSPYSYMQPGSGTVVPTFYEGTTSTVQPAEETPAEELPPEPESGNVSAPAEEAVEEAAEEVKEPAEELQKPIEEAKKTVKETKKLTAEAEAAILLKPQPETVVGGETDDVPELEKAHGGLWLYLVIGAAVITVAAAVGSFAVLRYRKNQK